MLFLLGLRTKYRQRPFHGLWYWWEILSTTSRLLETNIFLTSLKSSRVAYNLVDEKYTIRVCREGAPPRKVRYRAGSCNTCVIYIARVQHSRDTPLAAILCRSQQPLTVMYIGYVYSLPVSEA